MTAYDDRKDLECFELVVNGEVHHVYLERIRNYGEIYQRVSDLAVSTKAMTVHHAPEQPDSALEPTEQIHLEPPGVERISLLSRLCMSAEAHERLIWPTIQDLYLEYADAQKAGDRVRALGVLIRGYRSVALPWLYGLVARVVRWVSLT